MPLITKRFALRLVIPTLLAAAPLLLSPGAAAAKAAWAPGTYLNQALVRIMASTRNVTEKTRYGLDDASTCFIAAYFKEGKSFTSRIPLTAGTQYAFIGGGDDDTQDLDIYVEDNDGNVLAKDDATDAVPVVVFTPKTDGKYRIVLKLARCKAGGSFACYATLRNGGFDVPVNNLAAAGGRLISLCETVNDKLGPAYFHDGEGELCLIGSIMTEGQTLTQGGFVLEDRPYAFVGTADDVAEDIDLKVVDADGTVVAKDEDKDATPIVLYSKGGTVSLKLSDAKSKGASLCMAAALKLKAK